MKPTASRPRRTPANQAEAGFTLTELTVGLLVTSMLIVGLAEVTRRHTQTAVRTKQAAMDIRAIDFVSGLMGQFERVDPGSIEVTPARIAARLGSAEIRAELIANANGTRQFEWSSPTLQRSIPVPEGARFEETAFGAVVLLDPRLDLPLAIVTPRRTAPFDCRFDAVVRDCR